MALLRKKAAVLESENVRLSTRLAELLRENLKLQGVSAEAIELNLPGLLAQASGKPPDTVSSERRAKPNKDNKDNKKGRQKGHGPTVQPDLEIVHETFDVDDADKICTQCGGELEEWKNAEDEVEVIDIIERKWVIRKCTLKKYRCNCGGCVETAEGPQKLIEGGRYTLEVGIDAAMAKYDYHRGVIHEPATPPLRAVRDRSVE